MRTGCLWLVLAVWMGAMSAPARGCQIPVFRYALERWAAEEYEVIVFHKGALTGEQAAAVDVLAEGQDLANIRPSKVDLAGTVDAELKKLWESQKGASLPWVVVRCPKAPGEVPPAWSGPLTKENMARLIDSPARREIARRIMKGESAVWVMLESGNRGKDDAAAKVLAEELKKAEKTIELPKVEDDDPTGPRLLSELPVKVGFSVLRVSREDAAERVLVGMLTAGGEYGAENKAAGAKTLTLPSPGVPGEGMKSAFKPMVFPVFGRGRALGPLVGERIEPEGIMEGASFLCGPCSCQVKDLNPGFDLLLAGDWEAMLEGRKPREADFVKVEAAGPQRVPVVVRKIDLVKVAEMGAVVGAVVLMLGVVMWRAGKRRRV